MALVKTTISFPYGSGLERDVAQHTWWFTGPDIATMMSPINDALEAFYQYGEVETVLTIQQYMSGIVVQDEVTIRMVQVSPSTGLEMSTAVIAPFLQTSDFNAEGQRPLPAEVALCLSYRGNALDVPKRSRTGRVYLGPWSASTILGSTGGTTPGVGEDSRPEQELITRIIDAYDFMRSQLEDDTITHSVYSRTLHEVTQVGTAWVDDAWDTQRRRGQDPENRLYWPIVLP